MWRSLQIAVPTKKGCHSTRVSKCLYGTSSSKSGTGKKTVITIIAVTGLGAGATLAYGKYDQKFRKLVEDNVPFSGLIFKSLLDWDKPKDLSPAVSDKMSREDSFESSLMKKKQERLKKEEKPERKPQDMGKQEDNKKSESAILTKQMVTEDKSPKPSVSEPVKHILDEPIAIENLIKDLLIKAEKSTSDAMSSQEAAVEAIKSHTNCLYKALDTAGESQSMEAFKEVDTARSIEATAVKVAQQKAIAAQSSLDKLKIEIRKGRENKVTSRSSTVFTAEASVSQLEKQLKEAEIKVAAAQSQSQTAAEYRELVEKAREQFKNELQIVLPKYVHKNRDQMMTEEELNLLIAHAHRRIEHLQRELARQQVTEKHRVEEAMKLQKSEDEKVVDARIETAIAHHQKKMEEEFQQQLDVIEEEFEADMRYQLRRQAAVHADHLQEALHIQKQEMQRRHIVELEEKMLQQKGIFISEISGSMAKLKGIEDYLKARAQLNEAARKTQALWLACQAMKNALKCGFSENPKPLGKELAIIKHSGDDSPFITTVLSGIPLVAVRRGVFSDEYLKQRFNRVKHVCRQVAMIDEYNGSLYRYILSYIQSFFIIDSPTIPVAEIENKVAVDPSEWDTFDILNRISFCLQRNDMEQALRYANQLKGEPLNVASDWIDEVRLLLETSQAVDCLIAYASAIGIQAYH